MSIEDYLTECSYYKNLLRGFIRQYDEGRGLARAFEEWLFDPHFKELRVKSEEDLQGIRRDDKHFTWEDLVALFADREGEDGGDGENRGAGGAAGAGAAILWLSREIFLTTFYGINYARTRGYLILNMLALIESSQGPAAAAAAAAAEGEAGRREAGGGGGEALASALSTRGGGGGEGEMFSSSPPTGGRNVFNWVYMCSTNPDAESTRELEFFCDLFGRRPSFMAVIKPGQVRKPASFPFASVDTFSQFLTMNQRHQVLSFNETGFSREHSLALSAHVGPVLFRDCSFEDNGRSFFREIAAGRSSVNSFALYSTRINARLMGRVLQETDTLKVLTIAGPHDINLQLLFQALPRNRGLVEFNVVTYRKFRNSEWEMAIRSVQGHRTLEKMSFCLERNTHRGRNARGVLVEEEEEGDSTEDRAHRARIVIDMLKANGRIHSLNLDGWKLDDEVLREKIRVLLRSNWWRSRAGTLVAETDSNLQKRLLSPAFSPTELNQNPTLMYTMVLSLDDLLARYYTPKKKRKTNIEGKDDDDDDEANDGEDGMD